MSKCCVLHVMNTSTCSNILLGWHVLRLMGCSDLLQPRKDLDPTSRCRAEAALRRVSIDSVDQREIWLPATRCSPYLSDARIRTAAGTCRQFQRVRTPEVGAVDAEELISVCDTISSHSPRIRTTHSALRLCSTLANGASDLLPVLTIKSPVQPFAWPIKQALYNQQYGDFS